MNKYIEIEKYDCPVVSAFHVDGTKIGDFRNEHECNKFRIKCLEQGVVKDYYFMYGDIKITMDEEGNMSSFPRGMYDQLHQDMAAMFFLSKEKKKDK
jgi:hypothetical protein